MTKEYCFKSSQSLLVIGQLYFSRSSSVWDVNGRNKFKQSRVLKRW